MSTESIKRPNYRILKDESINNSLIHKGFVVLPMLTESEITIFNNLYKKWHPTDPKEFYKSYFSNNVEYKNEVEQTILKYCTPKLEEYFVEYLPFGAMFVVKPKGEKGHIPPHQDWSFVDETLHWSLNMWLPLQDVDENTGTIRFLEGSHFFMQTIRGAETPELYSHLKNEIELNLTDISLKAGEAVFFYHGIVHCSHYNENDNARVCLGLSLVQTNVPIYFHFLKQNEELPDKFEVNTSFFINYAHNRDKMPDRGNYLGKNHLGFRKLTNHQLLEKIKQRNKL